MPFWRPRWTQGNPLDQRRKLPGIDLGCGPGSLAQRIVDRIPVATVVAVDADPVLLSLAMAALGDRTAIRFVDADLRQPEWFQEFERPPSGFDAVVSTTALHWLAPADLVRVYGDIRNLLRDGGLFLNGDYLVLTRSPHLRRLGETAGQSELASARSRDPDALDWDGWWSRLELEVPTLREAMRERSRRYDNYGSDRDTSAEFQLAALSESGFVEAEVLWRSHGSSIIGAMKAPKAG